MGPWVRTQRVLEFAWVACAGGVAWLLLADGGRLHGRLFMFGGAGFLLVTWFVFETLSLVTRRRAAYDPAIAWPGVVLAVGLVPLLLGVLFLSTKLVLFGLAVSAALAPVAWGVRRGVRAAGRLRATRLREAWQRVDDGHVGAPRAHSTSH